MSTRQIEVFQVGCPVIIGDNITAKVVAINIRDKNYITYECAWWSGCDRKSLWFEQNEVRRSEDSTSIKIGFVSG